MRIAEGTSGFPISCSRAPCSIATNSASLETPSASASDSVRRATRCVPSSITFMELQHRYQSVQRSQMGGLSFGKRGRELRPPAAQPILQRLMQLGGALGGGMPVAREGKRFVKALPAERLQQVVDDVVSET